MQTTSTIERRRPSAGARAARILGRVLAVILTTVLLFAVFLIGVMAIVTRGPSREAERLFVLSARETSALKFLPSWFLSEEEIASIVDPPASAPDPYRELAFEPQKSGGDAPAETPAPVTPAEPTDELEIIDIRKSTFKGKLMIVHDPSRVVVGTLAKYGGAGLFLTEFVAEYGAVAGTNAGGFDDPDGMGNGGIPDGLVIRDGQIAYGSPNVFYSNVISLDADHILHVGNMTGQQALNLGAVSAVSFAPGPVLIQDGVRLPDLGGGVNPRTCIGQRADGAMLLAVIEGRHPDSIGATFDDIADLMVEYGAINAANLDGGSSSTMIYEGEQITRGSTLVGARRLATAILVLPPQGGAA